MNMKIYSQGKIVSDKVLLRKFREEDPGCFETIRLYFGRIFREQEHIERLYESAKTLGYKKLPAPEDLKKELRFAARAYGEKEAILRLTVMQGRIFVIANRRTVPEKLYRCGVALRTSGVRRSLSNAVFPEAKSAAYQNAILAGLAPRPGEIYEWIFLDRNGYVTEVSAGNLFILQRGSAASGEELVTPPVLGILNGVTRRFVIKCATFAKLEVRERFLTRHDLFNAREVFLTNTSWEILPVREIDGRVIATSTPGPQTLKLHQIFRQKVGEECRNMR